MIRFSHVFKRYPGGYDALKNISFELNQGEMAFLTGHSGAGKSSLLRLIALIERPTRGDQRRCMVANAGMVGDIGRAPGLEELGAAAEGAGAEGQRRDHQAGSAQLPVFHRLPLHVWASARCAARTPLRAAASSVGGYSGSV